MKTVLVVDDASDLRELFAYILRHAGYAVIEAEHGAHALELLTQTGEVPDLIVLDLNMPVMDGETFLKTARMSPRLRNVPSVLVSAACRLGNIEGARCILKKPVSAEALMRVAHELCGPA